MSGNKLLENMLALCFKYVWKYRRANSVEATTFILNIFAGFLSTLKTGDGGLCPWCLKTMTNLKVHVEDVHYPIGGWKSCNFSRERIKDYY